MDTYAARIVVSQAGYCRERLPGGILILRLLDSRPETIDAWFEDCNRLMRRWQPWRHLCYLHDIRGAEIVNAYTTDRVVRILRRMRHIPVTDARGGILMCNPALTALLSSFLGRHTYANWQIRFFHDEPEAIRWLQGQRV